ncbi:LuxR family transcriptional regulator [Subtercola boreus]|uniref:LuxR family transcriptional regulator n=1 Tax=Subtercola boreus TaxID=120213 RepID=A0A3E0VMV0_9MICO|nr:response regulator transcription factor [Subtercola boreus]RFA11216.1 LuxR family transcriptional regulator [Subtercola boreus]TQL53285.1 LuxR family two component transcriptional regulator [Subtercola boreus]
MTTTHENIRLAIVDDHRMLLGALTEWIRGAASDINMVAAVTTWPDLLTNPEFPVDVVLLDLDLKDNLPISVKLRALKSAGVKTVLMSTYSEPVVVREALAAGALGYLVKSEEADMIVEAIRSAAKGEPFISSELDLALSAQEVNGSPKLSAQERRVMALYGGGEPVKQVAEQLSISEETAKSYLKRIREKYRVLGIDVGTKVALRKRAIQDGLLIQDDYLTNSDVSAEPHS